MATCKDCIHSGICKVEQQPAPLSDTFTYECECIEKYCIDFKDRSGYAEQPLSGEERFRKCIQELIDIAKASQTPSKVLQATAESLAHFASELSKIEGDVENG